MSNPNEEKYVDDEDRQEPRGVFKRGNFNALDVEEPARMSLGDSVMGRKGNGMQGLRDLAPNLGKGQESKMYGMLSGYDAYMSPNLKIGEPMKQDSSAPTEFRARPQPIPYQAPEVKIPSFESYKVKEVKHPVRGYRTIKLNGVNNDRELAQVFQHLYAEKLFVGKEKPNTIHFKPMENFKCRVSFTHNDNFDTCKLEFQAWRDTNDSKSPYLIEFIQKSVNGRETFNYLITRVAAELKAMGKASKYGNDREIFAPVVTQATDPNDPLQMPTPLGGVGPTHQLRFTVKDEQASNWVKILSLRTYPIFSETIRIIAKAVEEDNDRENLKIISTKREVFEACCKELNDVLDPATVHNVLRITDKLVQLMLEESDADGLKEVVDKQLLLAVVKTLAHNCGAKKVHKHRWMRSVAIEERATALLWKLAAHKDRFNNFSDSKMLQDVLDHLGRIHKQLTAQSHKCMVDLTEGIRDMLAAH